MLVLVACEESQEVCKAFRKLGHEAYSCDILECSGGHPEWHIQNDVLKILEAGWDMLIAHPPCTYLSTTGNRWFDTSKWGEAARERYKKRYNAICFFMQLACAPIERIAIENPVGIMSTAWRKADQIIQPYMFGDGAEKRTALWLKNLPKLEPTNIVKPPARIRFASGRSMPEWYANAWNLPKDERAKFRSKTFPGIAKAMAEQWGGIAQSKEGF